MERPHLERSRQQGFRVTAAPVTRMLQNGELANKGWVQGKEELKKQSEFKSQITEY